jgi:Tfp pilus assembly protein PilV
MSSERGFTLVEVLVAGAIGVVAVLGFGLLQETCLRRRASTNATATATSLAEQELEQLLAELQPETAADLTAGLHGPNGCAAPPCKIDETGAATVNGPFRMQWAVVDGDGSGTAPLFDPSHSTKEITMTVTHVSDAYARATLVTRYKYK